MIYEMHRRIDVTYEPIYQLACRLNRERWVFRIYAEGCGESMRVKMDAWRVR